LIVKEGIGEGVHYKYILSILSLSVISVTASEVSSANLSIDELRLMSLDELLNIKVETAGKKLQKKKDVPASIYVITEDEIEEGGFMSLMEALNTVPGIQIDRTWYLENIVVRGDVSSDTKLLLMVDGQSMTMRGDNFNIFNGAAPIEMRDIKRIEVILGPNSVLYGSGAFNGVVNIISKNAADGFMANLNGSTVGDRGGYASYGEQFDDMKFSLSSGLQRPQGSKLDFVFPGGTPPDYTQTQATADGFNTTDSFRMATKLENEVFSIRAQYSDSRIVWPDSRFDTDFNNAGSYYNIEHLSVQTSYRHQLSEKTEALLRLYYIDSEGAWRGVYSGVVYPTPGGNERWLYGGQTYGGEYRTVYTPSASLSLVSGVEFTDTFDSYSADYSRSYTNTSLFTMLNYRFHPNLFLHAGARVEKYSYRNHAELLPQVALTYKPVSDASLKLAYSEGFLAPSTWDMQIADFVGNNNLDPERIKNYEFIYEHRFAYFSQSLSLYYAEHSDQIVTRDTGFQATSVSSNSPYERVYQGADWNAHFLPFDATSVKLGLSYNDARDKDETNGQTITTPGSYDLLGYLSLKQKLPDNSIMTLIGKYVDQPNGYENIDAYTRIDLTWLKKNVAGFTLRAKLSNLFDEKVETYSLRGAESIPDNGRALYIDISRQF